LLSCHDVQKLKRVFPGNVVRKSLVRDAGLSRLPRYVVEYLIANHVNEEKPQEDLKKICEHVERIFPDAETREALKAQLRREGEIVVIDRAAVSVNLKTGSLVCSLTFVGENHAEILDAVVDQNPRLLTGGVWGAYRLRYIEGTTKKEGFKLIVVGLLPFQSEIPDQDELARKRSRFTRDEWVDLLLTSVGYNTDGMNQRLKMLYLTRLIPAVEPNVNLIELGPRQTGKTFLLRNVSPSVYTASGSNVSSASLFANVTTGAMGILGSYKVVQMDEIAHTRFDDASTISMMKDFMESGQFSRGGKTYSADTSIILAGNIDVNGDRPADGYRHLFEPLPASLQDTAFLDRIHGYIPGWEIPKLTPDSISEGHGLVVDYLGQALGVLRTRNRRGEARTIELPSTMSRRDVVAVEKLTSGFIKLIYTNDRYSKSELTEIVDFAIELRQRVNNELAEMAPGEFKRRELEIVQADRRLLTAVR
jgi:ATP-dependent Lon protease